MQMPQTGAYAMAWQVLGLVHRQQERRHSAIETLLGAKAGSSQ